MIVNKFWVILYCDQNKGSNGPLVRHASREEAAAEATRLVAKHKAGFIVLEAIEVVAPKTSGQTLLVREV